ncbi:MAG: Signal transduction histidine kinase, partial [Marmoricola sp.]|nr:Signal transduction histidine kinase [Marmoricola sp.]
MIDLLLSSARRRPGSEVASTTTSGASGSPATGTSGDTGPVLRIANLAVRVLLLVLVGAFVFTDPWPGTAKGVLEVVAFAVATALLAVWVPADRAAPGQGRYTSALPWALGAIALLCGAASAVPPGNLFIILGVTATVSAGSDASLAAGCAVLALGIVGTESVGLSLGASTSVTLEYPIVLLLGFVLGRNLQTHRLRAEQSEQLREKQAA